MSSSELSHQIQDIKDNLNVTLSFLLNSHNKSSSENSMNRFTLMSQKDSGLSHIKSKHCRSNSIKSNHHSIGKKIPVSMKIYEKILTQTTSKYKRSQQITPKRSCSTGKKSKVDKTLNDSKTLKNARKGGLEKEKLFMAQSLNIPNIESFVNEDYMRNSSQQLSTNNMERSINLPLSLAEILSRTQSVCQSYEKTCKSMQKHQREVERELTQAKIQIAELQAKLSMKKHKQP